MAVVEHPDNPNLLFAGVHNGLMVSADGGRSWTRATGNIPPVSVNDIKIKNGDLVLGTYGRGILIMDDIGFLVGLTADILAEDAHLFEVRDAERYYLNNRGPSNKAARFAGANPDYGALITYYLREGPGQEAPAEEGATEEGEGQEGRGEGTQAPEGPPEPPGVSFQILDQDGSVIRELTGPDRQGINRIAWDLRMAPDTTDTQAGEETRRRPSLVDVEPGLYTVKLIARGRELLQTVMVVPDRRSN
jgi:hypothetical protein